MPISDPIKRKEYEREYYLKHNKKNGSQTYKKSYKHEPIIDKISKTIPSYSVNPIIEPHNVDTEYSDFEDDFEDDIPPPLNQPPKATFVFHEPSNNFTFDIPHQFQPYHRQSILRPHMNTQSIRFV